MPPVGAGCQLLGPHPRLRVKLHDARAGCRCYAADGAHVCVPNAAVMTPSPTLLKRPHGWCPPGPLLFGRRACGPTPGGPLHVTSFEPSIISAALTLTDFVMGASQPRLALPVLLLILLSLSSGSLVSAARHRLPTMGRFNLKTPTPQDPTTYNLLMKQHPETTLAPHSRQQGHPSTTDLPREPDISIPQLDSSSGIEAQASLATSRRSLLQEANATTVQPANVSDEDAAPPVSSTTDSSSSDNNTGTNNDGPHQISLCPAWAPAAANISARAANPYAAKNSNKDFTLTFTADFNNDNTNGLTAHDREEVLSYFAGEAIRAAANHSGLDNSSVQAIENPKLRFEAGLFEPLSIEESLAVYAFLYNHTKLNLTALEQATNNDNFVVWIEWREPVKAEAIAYLDDQARVQTAAVKGQHVAARVPKPVRTALAVLIEGRHDPPRVTQVVVWPLANPTHWKYVPMGPAGQMEAGWLQRPYSGPEAGSLATLINNHIPSLNPMLNVTLDGWTFDANGTTCGSKCLTFSLGAPFGSGAAASSGSIMGNNSAGAQRYMWAYFYRNQEGHHLHTVGLEVQIDVKDVDPNKWTTGKVWFADRTWPSIKTLVATWNSTRTNSTTSQGVSQEAQQELRAFRVMTPNATDALFSTFVPRSAPGKPLPPPDSNDLDAAAVEAVKNGGPISYEPTGRRFRLAGPTGNTGLEDWMGWSFSLGHKPTAGLSFWDIRFKGERIVYELSLQEAYAGYGGPTPMQSHVEYLDSHWGLGAAYKELVAGQDCPLNAAYMDISYTFMGGPMRQQNAVCVFEMSLGQPLMRHWADTGGGPAYYGNVPGNALVVRAISAVYNYDYVQDMKLHLDGSIEVAVHTTGYVQSARYNRAKDGNQFAYPYWHDNSGTIHDHLLNWKVDLDIVGTDNSIRMDQVVLQERDGHEAFDSPHPWFTKHLVQKFPQTEAEAALFANGSSKAAPNERAPQTLFYVVNENELNRWGSARGYRLQHTLVAGQIVPPPEKFGNTKGIGWSQYKVAATARREWEPSSSSALNQALPFAPTVDFQQLLSRSDPVNNVTKYSDSADPGDKIRGEDIVLWVTSGLQHLPGSEDAPVTPTSGPGIGFWLRPFNYFDENAAASQPGMVYIPALTEEAAYAAAVRAHPEVAAAEAAETANGTANNALASQRRAGGHPNDPRATPQAGIGNDTVQVVGLISMETLQAARWGIQPYIAVPLSATCLPNWGNVPFNGTYTEYDTYPPTPTAEFKNGSAGSNSTGNVTQQMSVAPGASSAAGRAQAAAATAPNAALRASTVAD